MIFEDADKVIKSKAKGAGWVEMATPVLINVNAEIKDLQEKRDEETSLLRAEISSIEAKYRPGLEPLENLDKMLRDRVTKEKEGTQAVHGPDGGKLVFAETLDIVPDSDIKNVDKAYVVLSVDLKKVKMAVASGIRNIKGIKLV